LTASIIDRRSGRHRFAVEVIAEYAFCRLCRPANCVCAFIDYVNEKMLYQKVGKELMSQDEIAVMDGGKAILQLRGVRPFISAKFDITKHRNYKYLSDFDKRNAFDTEKYLAGLRREKPIVKPDEPLDYYEIEEETEVKT
jgi:hypothetical protein